MTDTTSLVEPIIKSPCVRICRMDDVDGRCLGCSRTPEEIRHWFKISSAEKQAIIDSLPDRMRERLARRRREQEAG